MTGDTYSLYVSENTTTASLTNLKWYVGWFELKKTMQFFLQTAQESHQSVSDHLCESSSAFQPAKEMSPQSPPGLPAKEMSPQLLPELPADVFHFSCALQKTFPWKPFSLVTSLADFSTQRTEGIYPQGKQLFQI